MAQLFSPETSSVDLLSSKITAPEEITIKWRLAGVIKQLGVTFTFKPYTGQTVYELDAVTGLITRQTETWDTSILDVFASIFIPSFGAPPAPPADELRRRMGAQA